MTRPTADAFVGRPTAQSQAGELQSAVQWLESIESAGWPGDPLYERLFNLSAVDYAHAQILDVGSGPISVFEPIAPPGAHVIAYDSLADEYTRVAPANRFKIQADLPDAQFTLITILNCLDHMLAPEELVAALRPRLAPQGEVWIYCNIGQPCDPILHPQNFGIRDLVSLTEGSFRIKRCGLVREGRLFPYGWWAVCGPARASGKSSAAVARWTARCALTFAHFHGVRAAVKSVKLIGLRRLLPNELRF
jgi:hypothetical protein